MCGHEHRGTVGVGEVGDRAPHTAGVVGIEMCGRFVGEDEARASRADGDQHARHLHAAQLAARQFVARPFSQVGEIDVDERTADDLVGCCGGGADLVGDRPGVGGEALADHGQLVGPGGRIEVAQLDAVDREQTRRLEQSSPACFDQRRLPDPARPVDGGDGAGDHVEVESSHDRPVATTEADRPEFERTAGGCRPIARRQRRPGEQRVEVVGRVQAGLRSVEARADAPQREIAPGRQQQDHQCRAEIESATGQPQSDLDRDERHRQRGDQLERQRREERDPQSVHRRRAVLLGDLMDGVALGLCAAEEPKRGHALDHVEEVAAEALEYGPLPGRAALGHPPDQHHEHRDQRHGQRDQHRRQQVGEEDSDPDYERHGQGEDQRREELADVGLELVDAGGGDRGFPAGETATGAVGVESGVVEHGRADVGAQRPHRPGGRPLGHRRRCSASEGDRDEHEHERAKAEMAR